MCKEICLIEIVKEIVDECKEMLNDRWNGIEGIPLIQKSHYFECINKYALQYSAHSESDLMSTHTFKLVETLVPTQKEYNLPDNVNICKESYYAVFFDKTYYIGRVVNVPWLGKVTLKFLHSCGINSYNWSKRDDIITVKESYIFMGPLKLIGNGPFSIEKYEELLSRYQQLKSKVV